MPHARYLKKVVFPKMTIFDTVLGTSTTYDLGSYSTGYYDVVKPEQQRRKKPSNILDLSSLTSWGGHETTDTYTGQLNYSFPSGRYLYSLTDIDSSTYCSCGDPGLSIFPDWQTKLRLAIKDQKTNLAQSLAEFKQTQDMFASNATAIAGAFRNLKRGNVPGAFKALGLKPKQLRGTIANRWLELRYGWVPLLQDLHGSVEELQTAFNRPWFRRVEAYTKTENRQKSSVPGPLESMRIFYDFQHVQSAKAVAYVQGNPPVETRLGFTNPANLAWELLPYSFVVDWFIPIGDWLNAMDAERGTTNCYGTVTTKDKVISTTSAGSYYLRRTYGRAVFYGVPSIPLPRWNPSLGVGRIANALALLGQTFKDDIPSSRRRPDGRGTKRSAPGFSWDDATRGRLRR